MIDIHSNSTPRWYDPLGISERRVEKMLKGNIAAVIDVAGFPLMRSPDVQQVRPISPASGVLQDMRHRHAVGVSY